MFADEDDESLEHLVEVLEALLCVRQPIAVHLADFFRHLDDYRAFVLSAVPTVPLERVAVFIALARYLLLTTADPPFLRALLFEGPEEDVAVFRWTGYHFACNLHLTRSSLAEEAALCSCGLYTCEPS